VFVTVMGMVVMRAATGMFLLVMRRLMMMDALGVVLVVSVATSAVRLGGGVLREKLLPAMFAAKVKGFPVAFGRQRRRLVHRHAANWVFGHSFAFRHFIEANARVPEPLHSILQFTQLVVASDSFTGACANA
jgi:hypothetical protein